MAINADKPHLWKADVEKKYHQLLSRFGTAVKYVLFLCGYFEPGYLGYEASEGIDWVWEHRLSDLEILLEGHESAQYRVGEDCLCANRNPWYLQEQRAASLFMATYMTRSRSGAGSPFRFFLNLSQAIGTNVFLLLYPKPALKPLLAGREDRLLEVLNILNGLAEEHVVREGRTYGGGLHKLEPRELTNLRLDHVPEWLQLHTQLRLALT